MAENRAVILQFDKTTHDFVAYYKGYTDAGDQTGFDPRYIRKNINGQIVSYKGFIFKSVDSQFFDYGLYLSLEVSVLEDLTNLGIEDLPNLDLRSDTDFKAIVDNLPNVNQSIIRKIDWMYVITNTKTSKNSQATPASLIPLDKKLLVVDQEYYNMNVRQLKDLEQEVDQYQLEVDGTDPGEPYYPDLKFKLDDARKAYNKKKLFIERFYIYEKEEQANE